VRTPGTLPRPTSVGRNGPSLCGGRAGDRSQYYHRIRSRSQQVSYGAVRVSVPGPDPTGGVRSRRRPGR
jgi:hypothetical protein